MDGERELRRGERRVAPGAQILVERGVAHVFDTPAFAAHEVVVSLSGQFVDRSGAVEAAACEYAGFEKHLHGVVYRGARYALAVFLENTTKPLDRKILPTSTTTSRVLMNVESHKNSGASQILSEYLERTHRRRTPERFTILSAAESLKGLLPIRSQP